MKKLLIGTLIGTVLLFGWQTLSWTVVGVHDNAYKYIPLQDSIIKYVGKQLPVEGDYMLPRPDPKLSKADQKKQRETIMRGPWTLISYHESFQPDMGISILKGFINCFICVLLACLVVRKFDIRYKTFFSLFTSVLTFGVISFLFIWYNQHNWFQLSWDVLWGELIDDIIGWGLAGAWLAWWWRNKLMVNG